MKKEDISRIYSEKRSIGKLMQFGYLYFIHHYEFFFIEKIKIKNTCYANNFSKKEINYFSLLAISNTYF